MWFEFQPFAEPSIDQHAGANIAASRSPDSVLSQLTRAERSAALHSFSLGISRFTHKSSKKDDDESVFSAV